MSRRPDAQRIDDAREAALESRLAGSGMAQERVRQWLDAWHAFAERTGVARDRYYWTRAWEWISVERDAGRGP